MTEPSAIWTRNKIPIEIKGIAHVSNARVRSDTDHIDVGLGMAEVVVDSKGGDGYLGIVVCFKIDGANHENILVGV